MFKKYKKKFGSFIILMKFLMLKRKKKLDFFQPKKCFSQNLVFKKKKLFLLTYRIREQ